MKNLKVEMDKTPAQGCEEEEFDSDSYWRCYMAHNTNPENHQVGTCRMGSTDDRKRGGRHFRAVSLVVFAFFQKWLSSIAS